MKTTSITIYTDTKGMLDKIKDDYKYKTIDECVKNICQFITLNRINPKAVYAEEDNAIFRSDIRMYFEDLRKYLRDDSQSLRKFLGALEKTYLKPLVNKLEIKDALQAIELAKPEPQEQAPKLDDLLPKNIPVASVENSAEIEKLKTKIEELNKANQEAFDIADNYKKMLKQIFSKITFMKSFISGDEICEIDMKKVDFLKLKEQSGII